MDSITRTQIIRLINKEVIPAIGCTEPVAVALAAAKAAELLGEKPDKIEVFLSANVLKNAMGVGIPGTGMVGLPIAIALGFTVGNSSYGLEVLRDITSEGLEEAKQLVAEKRIAIALREGIDKLYIEVTGIAGNDRAKAIICTQHTGFVYLEKNGEILLDKMSGCPDQPPAEEECDPILNYATAYAFATETPLEELRFILRTAELNKQASETSLTENFGLTVGKVMRGERGRRFMGDSFFTRMIARTAAACDARMDGAMIPVMTNSGSGNQGISATLPVVSFAEDNDNSEEELIRALALSHLIVIYTKQSLGRLSALCGCVVAAMGAGCGITYLMGGNKTQISYTIKNMIGNLTGMICDGAKPGCALKVSGGVSNAMISALMAMENRVVTSVEGIIDEDVDKTIANLTLIGASGMEQTDRLVLDIMTSKA